MTSQAHANPGWFDPEWPFRRPITIVNSSDNTLEGYQIEVLVPYDSDMLADFADLRFTDSDGTTPLSYWVETFSPRGNAKVWVKVPSIPPNTSHVIYMYYGNPAAVSSSDAQATFIRVIDGVRGSWHFEGSGDLAKDSSGFGNHGTLGGYHGTKHPSGSRTGGTARL